jgi:hypothetical protein
MRQILQKALEYGGSTFRIFTDFKAAYDTINKKKLLVAMKEIKIHFI